MPSASSKNVRAGGVFVEFLGQDGKLRETVKSVSQTLRSAGKAMTISGMAVAGTGATMLAPFAASAKTAADFGDAMAQVRAVLNPSDQQFTALEEKALALGKAMKFTATEAAQGAEILAVAGFSAEEILSSLDGVLQLAATDNLSMADAADIAAKTIRGMAMDASQAARVADVLAKGSITANTRVADLGEAFKHAAPIAHTFGMSVEELTAAVQIMSDAGTRGEMAGTSLRGMLLSLTSPTAEATAELGRLGVSVTDQSGKIRPFVSIMKDLEAAYAGVPNGEKMKSLGTIFPTRQTVGVDALLSRGASAIAEKTMALQEAGGTAAKVSAARLNSLKGDMVVASSTLEALSITVGRLFDRPLRGATQFFTFLVNKAISWAESNSTVIYTLAAVAAGVTLAGTAIFGLGAAVSAVGIAGGAMATAWGGLAAVVGAIVSPAGLAVAAIAGIAYWSGAGGEALGWLREQFGPLLGTFSETIAAISTAMSAGNWEAAGNAAWAGLKLAWVQGSQAIQNLWREWSTAIVDTFKGTVDVISSVWANTIGFVESKLAKAQNKTASWIISAQASLGLMSEEEAKAAQDELVSMGQEAQDRIKNDVDAKNQAIFDNAEKRQKAADEAKSQALADAERELAEAKAAADAAIQEALSTKPKEQPASPMAKLKQWQSEDVMGQAVVQSKSMPSSGGTFSRLASQMFGVQSQEQLARDQLRTQREIAENTRRMANWSPRYSS